MLYRQGHINFIVNREPKRGAIYFAAGHGASACGLAFRVKDAHKVNAGALELGAQPLEMPVGSMELPLPATKGIGGAPLYMIHRSEDGKSIYDITYCGLGRSFKQPVGQLLPAGAMAPIVAPSDRMDCKLELGFFVSRPNVIGDPIPFESAEEHVLARAPRARFQDRTGVELGVTAAGSQMRRQDNIRAGLKCCRRISLKTGTRLAPASSRKQKSQQALTC